MSSDTAKKRGFEYKSKFKIFGIPFIHISFVYGKYFIPKPAKGIISIGHFGVGIINISQVGIGVFNIGQIAIAVFAIAQVALSYSCIAQVAIFFNSGSGYVEVDLKQEYAAYTCESDYSYKVPEKIDDSLDVGHLEKVGINPTFLEEAVGHLECGRYKEVHSMLIFKDDKLVLEEYFKGHKFQWNVPGQIGALVDWDRETPHDICSDAKSVTSALIGIAIDKGFIKSVDQSIFDYLPEHQHLKKDGRERITIEHLLTMTSGLQWKEWGSSFENMKNPNVEIWFQKKDPITYILEKSLINTPGTKFNYSTGNMMILGEILKNSSQMPLEEFSKKYLFEQLNINSFNWASKFKNGVDSNTLEITPRDMVKFGVTYLNKGNWNGKQVVPEEWVNKSKTPFAGNRGIDVPGEDSGILEYSYSWWLKEYNISGKKIKMFYAGGFGGQNIMVFPDLNMVVAFTGGNYYTYRPPFEIISKYVLPSMEQL